MKLLYLLLLLVSISAFPDSFDDEDDDIEDAPHSKPRVAWVPIVQRNMSAAVGEVLIGEKESKEKLNRIGKMLEDSYDQWNRDMAEGDMKIRQLEQKQNFGITTAISWIVLLLSFIF